MMDPIILAHGFEDARAAVVAAAGLGRPVTIISEVAAAGHGGGAWFREMIAAAVADHPEVAVTAILDCADLPGLVLGALRAGVRAVRFTGPEDAAARLQAIAEAGGARFYRADSCPRPWLQPTATADPVAACRAWLAASATPDRTR